MHLEFFLVTKSFHFYLNNVNFIKFHETWSFIVIVVYVIVSFMFIAIFDRQNCCIEIFEVL